MRSVLDRYVVATYLKYYVLFVAVLSPSMIPVFLRLSTSAAYLPAMMSIVGSGALCATLLEFGYRREMTTLQRYGVGYAQMFRPLLGVTLVPLTAVSAFAVFVASSHRAAAFWSLIALGGVTICAVVAFRGAWFKREAGTARACAGGLICHAAVLAVVVTLS